MSSVSEKRRKRKLAFNIRQAQAAGRPRLDGERYPSGKRKPIETENDIKSVAIAAAERVHGIKTDGKEGFHGYTLGRMYLDGKVSLPELEIGNWYCEQIAKYHSLTGVPFPSARAQDLFAVRGEAGEVTKSRSEAARRASELNSELIMALCKCDNGAQVRITVYNVCVMDVEGMRMMPAHQVEMLKTGLRRLMFFRGARG